MVWHRNPSKPLRLRDRVGESGRKDSPRESPDATAVGHQTQQSSVAFGVHIPAERANGRLSEYVHRGSFAVSYDEAMLDRARTQWQFGDWESLAKIDLCAIQDHPDRAKLALLAASGHLQTGDPTAARQFISLAQEWGCSRLLITQILVAGVHNSLGRASAIIGEEKRAIAHFKAAIEAGTPEAETRLLFPARLSFQLTQLGLLTPIESSPLPQGRQAGIRFSPDIDSKP